MGNQNRKATKDEMAHVRQVIVEAFPEFEPVFGGHGAYNGHRAPRVNTISFRLRDRYGKFHSNVVWLMPDAWATLTAEDIVNELPKAKGSGSRARSLGTCYRNAGEARATRRYRAKHANREVARSCGCSESKTDIVKS